MFFQWDGTTAHAFAGIFARLGTTTALALALVVAGTFVGRNCCTGTFASTRILTSTSSTLALIESTTDMFFAHQQADGFFADCLLTAFSFGGCRAASFWFDFVCLQVVAGRDWYVLFGWRCASAIVICTASEGSGDNAARRRLQSVD